MKVFFDSSSFVKRFVEEVGSDEVEKICQETSVLSVCVILLPEIISAFNRKFREHVITTKEYLLLKKTLMNDIQDVTIIQLTPNVISLTIELLEKNKLRGMDSLHLACALEWKAELFVTADKQQAVAAQNAGMKIKLIVNDK